MPTPTYDLIEEKVLGSAQASVTFSSIPGTYKDIVFEIVTAGASLTYDTNITTRFNSDSSTLYSSTTVRGTGSAANSFRNSNENAGYWFNMSGTWMTTLMHVMSYANTNVNKTAITRYNDSSQATWANVGLYRSTSAITSVTFASTTTFNFATNSVFRLWGVSG